MDGVVYEGLRYNAREELSADDMLILGRMARGEDDQKIQKWSGGWCFDQQKIARARKRIYKVFGLNVLDDERAKQALAVAFYRLYQKQAHQGFVALKAEYQKRRQPSKYRPRPTSRSLVNELDFGSSA